MPYPRGGGGAATCLRHEYGWVILPRGGTDTQTDPDSGAPLAVSGVSTVLPPDSPSGHGNHPPAIRPRPSHRSGPSREFSNSGPSREFSNLVLRAASAADNNEASRAAPRGRGLPATIALTHQPLSDGSSPFPRLGVHAARRPFRRRATSDAASAIRWRAITLQAISRTRQASSVSAVRTDPTASSSQAQRSPRSAQTRSQYSGPGASSGLDHPLSGSAAQRYHQRGVCPLPTRRFMQPVTTAAWPRFALGFDTLSRGHAPHGRRTHWASQAASTSSWCAAGRWPSPSDSLLSRSPNLEC